MIIFPDILFFGGIYKKEKIEMEERAMGTDRDY